MRKLALGALFLLAAGAWAAAQDVPRAGQDGGLWLPYGSSTITPDVDVLYKIIFWVTAGMFFLVEGLLIAFMVMYRRRPGVKPAPSHGNRAAEIVWTAIPGLMLLALAFGQLPAWAKAKQQFPAEKDNPVVLNVLARQYTWNFRYRLRENAADLAKAQTEDPEEPGSFGPVTEDVHAAGMFVPVNRKALMTMTSSDVIHSLFIPHMRVKQDAVPGMYVRVWFEPNRFFVVNLKGASRPAGVPESRVWTNRGGQECVWVHSDEEYGRWFGDRHVAVYNFFEKDGRYESPTSKIDILYRGSIERDRPREEANFAVGIYEIACAELCGNGHFKMNSKLWVGTKEMYWAWLGRMAGAPADAVWKRWIDRKPAW